MTGIKWTRKTTGKISRQLKRMKINESPNTVARLLKHLGYALRVNHKKLSRSKSSDQRRDRNQQFLRIQRMRRAFQRVGLPIVSVDTKKKEMIGQFKNARRVWAQKPTLVNDHDFRGDAVGMAVPYGLLDLQANRGHIFVGTSHDTAEFAVDALVCWWNGDACHRYPGARRLLILADNGGGNGARNRAWKLNLQRKLANGLGVTVTVCHYPPGASKWNPIEHRLFSEVSKNWAGRPLDTYQTMLNYIRTTKTRTGLTVRATLVKRDYATGIKITAADMATLKLRPHRVLPAWNYSVLPRPVLV